MEEFSKWVQDLTGLNSVWQSRIFFSVLAIVILWFIRTAIIRLVWKQTDDPKARYRWRKGVGYIYVLIVLAILVRIWVEAATDIVTIFGFLTAGLTIALQDLVKSLAGWLFVLWRRPFFVGDRIQIGNLTGDVIDIRPFKFSMVEIGNWVPADQSTGRVMHVPNSLILSENIINYSEGFQFIWNEIGVLVTFESDWKKAKDILLRIANRNAEFISKDAESRIKEASKKYMIFYNKLTPIVYTSVKDCGVLLSIRYLIEPRRRRGSEMAVWEDVLTEFKKHDDIDFAYPTQRFYYNAVEGKPDAKAKTYHPAAAAPPPPPGDTGG